MATLGSKLVTKQMSWDSNMTDLNSLGAALVAKPTKLMGVMDEIFTSQNYYSSNPLSKNLMGTSFGEEVITSTEWEWELKGANTRPLVILENVLPASVTKPGHMNTTFKIKLDENWFVPGDIITPGTSGKKYSVRIMNEVSRHGDGWVYEVAIMGNPADYVPTKYLKPGQQWAKLYSQYEEATEQSGSTQFSFPLALRNKMSKFRKKYKITDYAAQEVLAVAMPDPKNKGKMLTSWMNYAEVVYWQQWYAELEKGFWYSRSTDKVMGANGRPVQAGPGIQEQLEDSNIHYYSHLTAKLIEEYLMDIFYSRVKPGKGRVIKGFTGEYGMLQFHRACQDVMEKKGFVQNIERFTRDTKSEYHGNAIDLGYQFTRYSMANGLVLELVHNPIYDDREINMEIDEVSGFPMESQRITFLDFAGDDSKSNIKLMKKKDSESFTYVCGAVGPYGPSSGHHSAHAGDYYEMHVGKTCGVHIKDVTKCGELILSRG